MSLLVACVVVGALLAATMTIVATPASAAALVYTYEVRGLGNASDANDFASQAAESLADSRGWSLGGSIAFQRVASGGQFTLWLSAAQYLPSFGYPCDSTYSCSSGRNVIINETRWLNATPSWNADGGSLRDYRHMVVNHEVGHWLGFGHASCGGAGQSAPVMQQQSISMQGCRHNPWPLDWERQALSSRKGVPILLPPPPPITNVMVGPGVGRNADGRLEAYALDQNRRLMHRWQVTPNGNWSGWVPSDFPAFAKGTPAVARNQDGRLEVFWLGDDNQMWHAFHRWPGGGWSQALPLGGTWPNLAGASVSTNADGRLELFTVGGDRRVWHIYQVAPNGTWSGWIPEPGGPWTGSPAAATNADGRLEVFAVGSDRRLWHSWQVAPNGTWSGFFPIDGGSWYWFAGTSPAVAANPDGRLEVFTVGLDRAIWHNFQVRPNGTWFGWQRLGPTGWMFRGSPAAGQNADGRLEVFVEGDDRQFWHNFQIRPNGEWFSWQPFGGTSL